jgi:uncharacterized membrane protein YfcA
LSVQEILLIAASGFAAGLLNAVAGGGTVFTYSALLAAGISPVQSNATSAVAVFLGSVASVIADRRHFALASGRLALLAGFSVLGGAVGAGLMLWSGDRIFACVVPWLVLLATLVFAASARLRLLVGAVSGPTGAPWTSTVVQGVVSVYGGYFSAGVGVMMLASLSLTEGGAHSQVNAAKNFLSIVLQSAAVVVFMASGVVRMEPLAIAAAACVVGGWLGVLVARSIPELIVRSIVIGSGFVLAAWLFLGQGR